ncbi:MAG: DUF11 domain-containing protein, partial [Flavobacteriales bacterium]|nr:DUF11 domain-containing protein [Flavobacteriales bacterium]
MTGFFRRLGIWGFWASGFGLQVSAQVVFIPDTNLRAWFNSYSPGCVDANGWFDPSDPGIHADTLFIISPDGNWDMTGFDALPDCRYLVMGSNTISGSLTSLHVFPDSVRHLEIEDHGALDSLTQLPARLQHLVVRNSRLTHLGTLPSGLRSLHFNAITEFDTLSSLPAQLEVLSAQLMPALQDITALPAGCRYLEISGCPGVGQLPLLPTSIETLRLSGMPLPTALPALPASLHEFWLQHMYGLQGPLQALPQGCQQVLLNDLPALTAIGALNDSLRSLYVMSCPTLTEVPDPLPPRLFTLTVESCPGIACLPLLHDSMQVYVEFTGIDCLPNLPVHDLSVTPQWLRSRPCSVFSPQCISETISGTTYQDLNANGILDPGEPPAQHVLVEVDPTIGVVVSNGAGHYATRANVGTYIIAPVAQPYVNSCSPGLQSASIVLPADMDSLNDFGLTYQTGVQDLQASVVMDHAWAGNVTNVWVDVRNVGTTTIAGQLHLELDTLCTMVTSSLPPTFQNGPVLDWSLAPIDPGNWINIHLTVSTELVQFGTPVTHAVTIDPLIGDANPMNNSGSWHSTVLYAYDPNDKQVVPETMDPAQIDAGGSVEYVIRFQNTGNFPASRVVILDTLDAGLDISSIHHVYASHAMEWSIHGHVLALDLD